MQKIVDTPASLICNTTFSYVSALDGPAEFTFPETSNVAPERSPHAARRLRSGVDSMGGSSAEYVLEKMPKTRRRRVSGPLAYRAGPPANRAHAQSPNITCIRS